MDNVLDIDEELDWDRVRFGREEKRGVILGLEPHQLVIFGIFMAIGVAVIIVAGFPWGAIAGLAVVVVGGGIALPRFQGRSILRWVGLWRHTKSEQLAGRGRYVRSVGELTAPASLTEDDREEAPSYRASTHVKTGQTVPGRPEHFGLPGALGELKGYELLDGTAFVYDPLTRYATVVAQVKADTAFVLESEDDQTDRIESFSAALTALSAQEGVEYIQLTDQTSVVSGQKILEHYRTSVEEAPPGKVNGVHVDHVAGESINAFAAKAYDDLVGGGQGIQAHEGWLVIVLGQEKLARTIKANGGGLGGFMDAAATLITSVTPLINTTGARVERWMNLRELSEVMRRASDPAAALELFERTGSSAGVAPHSAGPMAMVPHWRHVATDSALHRTWWISEWPRKRARVGFLEKVIFAGDFRHTVTLVAKPYPVGKAVKEVTKGLADWEAGINIQKKLGRPITRAQVLEGRDLSFREVQLTDGFGALKLGGYVTVSASTERELALHSAALLNAAAAAQVELRLMYGQQAEAFVASAMPLGRGLL